MAQYTFCINKFKANNDIINAYIKDRAETLNIWNSIDKYGTGFDYDYITINKASKHIKTPLIIADVTVNGEHLSKGLKINKASAVATANLFNFIGDR